MFKPVLTVLGMFILGLPTGADAAFTSGSIKPVYASCSAAGLRDSVGSYCGYSSSTIYTSTSGGSCSTTKTCYSGGSTVCSSSSYPYSSISNATMSGACTGYRSTAGGSCSGSSATYYSGFTCNSGYCKSGSACYNVCSTSSYPYSAISNATMSGACTGYTGTSASTCSGSSATRYSGFTCKSGYCKSGSACYNVCSTSSYPYSAISNATMSGACTGYTGTSASTCSGSSATRYSGFTCNSGYCKSGSACYNVCSTSSYPYLSVANATMSGACTGYTGTSAGSCSGSSTTRYSGFTCNSGYCKNGLTCQKTYSSCKAAGYLDTCASNCTATKYIVYMSDCSTKTCVSCTNCTAIDRTGCSSCCTTSKPYCYNNTCYSYCPTSSTGLLCPICAVLDEPISGTSCPGGARYSTCSCGGTHTALGTTAAHMCTVN